MYSTDLTQALRYKLISFISELVYEYQNSMKPFLTKYIEILKLAMEAVMQEISTDFHQQEALQKLNSLAMTLDFTILYTVNNGFYQEY